MTTVDNLKERVKILLPVTTQDAEANVITTWRDAGDRWACVEVKTANSKSSDAEWYRQVYYKITMRKTQLQYNARIIARGHTLRVTAPTYDIDNAFTVVTAVELDEL